METNSESRKKWRGILISTGFVLLFFLGYGWYNIVSHNQTGHKITTNSKYSKVSVKIDTSDSNTDKWETSIQVSTNPYRQKTVIGETRSCSVINNTKYGIRDWTLKLNIKQECYLNGFWCGDFEVHQFRNDKEIVERINSNQIDLKKLTLDHNRYSKNLMVHLLPGDYLIYYPSQKARENTIRNDDSVGIGFIFYYENCLDLTDFELIYYDKIEMIKTVHFKIFIILVILWVFSLIFYHAIYFVNQKYIERTGNNLHSISVMSEIYTEVHMLDLQSDSGYLIKGNQNDLLFNFIGCKLSDYFEKYIAEDCVDSYKEELRKFFDLSSVTELLSNTTSFSLEYQSKKRGWCSLRLFKIDDSKRINHLIFAVQDINKEKIRQHQEQEDLKQKEYSQMIRGSFMNTISFSTNGILGKIIATNQLILASAKTEEDKMLANSVIDSIEHLQLLQRCVVDMFALESETFTVNNQEYSLNDVINRVYEILRPFYSNKEYEVQKEIDSNIPEKLEGDKDRLMQILMLLLISSFMVTEKGFVKLSIFAKQQQDGYEELLFSIRDTANGFTPEQVQEVYSFLEGDKISSFDNPSLVYLKIIDGTLKHMGSQLRISSCVGQGSEFYFSVKQKIIG